MPKKNPANLNDEDIQKLLYANFKKSILNIEFNHDFSISIESDITQDFIRFLKESRDLQYSILIDILISISIIILIYSLGLLMSLR